MTTQGKLRGDRFSNVRSKSTLNKITGVLSTCWVYTEIIRAGMGYSYSVLVFEYNRIQNVGVFVFVFKYLGIVFVFLE